LAQDEDLLAQDEEVLLHCFAEVVKDNDNDNNNNNNKGI